MEKNQESKKDNIEESKNIEEIKEKENLLLNDIRDIARKFADDRDWNQYHTPRNLLLAMVGKKIILF
jgi:hypothetical protein